MDLWSFPVSAVHKLAVRTSARGPHSGRQQRPTMHATEALIWVPGSHRGSSFQNLAREACTPRKLLLELQISIVRRCPMAKDRMPSPWTSPGSHHNRSKVPLGSD